MEGLGCGLVACCGCMVIGLASLSSLFSSAVVCPHISCVLEFSVLAATISGWLGLSWLSCWRSVALLSAVTLMIPVSRILFGLVVSLLIVSAGDVGPIVCLYWLLLVVAFSSLLIVTSISLAWCRLGLRSFFAGFADSCTCESSLGGGQLVTDAPLFLSCPRASCVVILSCRGPVDRCGLLSGLIVGVVGWLGESMC